MLKKSILEHSQTPRTSLEIEGPSNILEHGPKLQTRLVQIPLLPLQDK